MCPTNTINIWTPRSTGLPVAQARPVVEALVPDDGFSLYSIVCDNSGDDDDQCKKKPVLLAAMDVQ